MTTRAHADRRSAPGKCLVVGGWRRDRVKHIVDVAVMRFEQHQTLHGIGPGKNSLAERKQIERAKGILSGSAAA